MVSPTVSPSKPAIGWGLLLLRDRRQLRDHHVLERRHVDAQPDFGSVLEWARALREQIDWDIVRARTEASPFAKAFFTLVEELGIVDQSEIEA